MKNILQILAVAPIIFGLILLDSWSTCFKLPSSNHWPTNVRGSEVIIRNHYDKGVVTVLESGDVIGDVYRKNDPMQIWTIEESIDNPVFMGRFRFIHKKVHYNSLSGPPGDPELFPKPWDIRTYGSDHTYELAVRGRWCLQSTAGLGRTYSVDDCEYDFYAPFQLWELELVSRVQESSGNITSI